MNYLNNHPKLKHLLIAVVMAAAATYARAGTQSQQNQLNFDKYMYVMAQHQGCMVGLIKTMFKVGNVNKLAYGTIEIISNDCLEIIKSTGNFKDLTPDEKAYFVNFEVVDTKQQSFKFFGK